MRDYFTDEPVTVPNPNVPDQALLIGHIESPREDFYCFMYDPPHPEFGRWALWRVTDQPGAIPQPVNFGELAELKILDGKHVLRSQEFPW